MTSSYLHGTEAFRSEPALTLLGDVGPFPVEEMYNHTPVILTDRGVELSQRTWRMSSYDNLMQHAYIVNLSHARFQGEPTDCLPVVMGRRKLLTCNEKCQKIDLHFVHGQSVKLWLE